MTDPRPEPLPEAETVETVLVPRLRYGLLMSGLKEAELVNESFECRLHRECSCTWNAGDYIGSCDANNPKTTVPVKFR